MVQDEHSVPELPAVKKFFRIGETILREGDPSDGRFVLRSGKVGVIVVGVDPGEADNKKVNKHNDLLVNRRADQYTL